MILSLTSAPLPDSFRASRALAKPSASTGGILPRALFIAVSLFTFPFKEMEGKAGGAGRRGDGEEAEGPLWEKRT